MTFFVLLCFAHAYNHFNCSFFEKFFHLSNNYASLDIIVKQKVKYGQRINIYRRKNPLAMSFLLTAKGLVFTISQQMLQASQT